VPAEAPPGKELTYKLIVENVSKGNAKEVSVWVTITNGKFVRATPAPTEPASNLIWQLGTILGCQKREITVVVMPSGTEEVMLCARVQFQHGQCVKTRIGGASPRIVPQPTPFTSPSAAPPPPPPKNGATGSAVLQVRRFAKSQAVLYDPVEYKLQVHNTGRGTATNVVVREELPKGLEVVKDSTLPREKGIDPLVWELGNLAPGQIKEIRYQIIAKSEGSLTLRTNVEATGVARQDSQHTIQVGTAKLSVRQWGPQHRVVGRNTTYHLTVTNTGNMTASGVVLSEELVSEGEKEAVDFVTASGRGRLQGRVVRWEIGSLAPGASRTVQLVVKARKVGTFKSVCDAVADRGLHAQGEAMTEFKEATGLAIEIEPDRDPVEVDQSLTIKVRVFNTEKVHDKNAVTAIALDDGLKLLSVEGVPGHVIEGQKVFLPKKDFDAGALGEATLKVQAEKAGRFKVYAEVKSDNVGPMKAYVAQEFVTVVPRVSTSRKPSTW
jgi:uncharacterized repeat protein (TIGR01451 family)